MGLSVNWSTILLVGPEACRGFSPPVLLWLRSMRLGCERYGLAETTQRIRTLIVW